MWHAYIGALITRLALPIMGGMAALLFGTILLLWWTNGQLSTARDRLAESRADTLTCIAANDSHRRTIRELEAAQARNRAERDAAIQRQQGAIERVEELERKQARDGSVERVIREPDPSACGDVPIPDGMRNAARSHSD